MTSIITTGGIGDVLMACQAATLVKAFDGESSTIYVNDSEHAPNFINSCVSGFRAMSCPQRLSAHHIPEHVSNLPKEFIQGLLDTGRVFVCYPDCLCEGPFGFPWKNYVRTYKEFMRVKVALNVPPWPRIELKEKPTVFANIVSGQAAHCWRQGEFSRLVQMLGEQGVSVIHSRTSSWKGARTPFSCSGGFEDRVDVGLLETMREMASCHTFLGIDSGLSHVAYHIGMPRLVLQARYNMSAWFPRWREDFSDDLPLETDADVVFNRIMLTLKEPLTTTIPAQFMIPAYADINQLIYRKYK